MARSIWSGSISFGLVTIPVALFSATDDHTVHFNQFERGTSDRIRYQRVNERTGKEVEYADIVRGHEVGDGEYVLVEPDELAAIAPGRSKSIEITGFVDLDEIDPIHFQKTYWLAPAKEEYGRPYALLTEALAKTNRVGIASFVMRGKQYLTDIRADDGVLALDTLYYADEIRDPHDMLDTLPSGNRPHANELKMATQLIESMAMPWRPRDFRDTYTRKVNKLIQDKHKGRKIVVEAEPPEPTGTTDLLEALRRSVERGRRPARSSSQVDDSSKAELAEAARELGIKGRSKMSRDELASAVKRATRKAS
ncbi:Ku protein [Kutzneria sp. 744]|uniref:non-homologous end joining protein Ku n=1 Tax=Kutzneria sp. (strain 744) TaxID=345341 RepID=UPI0003EEB9E0|nr:Ku protein [Kutzneria sp. 744]EWM10816.1 DNA end-binding protein Ku [Kutzneria sp. 744]